MKREARISNRVLGAVAAACAGAALTAWLVSSASAVSTRSFLLDSERDLSAGEMDGTAVHSDGSVTLGAQVTRLALGDEVAVAWTFARRGGSVYIGTGNKGEIYRLQGEQLEVFAETGQLLVSSLAFGDGDTLYAGTLPEGRIYEIDGQGETEELAELEDTEHVWDLVWDDERKRLFAATGPKGRVYAVDPQGSADVYYEGDAGHVMSLALADDGSLFAGTSDEAFVLRLDGPGRAEVVYDFPGNEITALDWQGGTLAVGANEFPDAPRVSSAKGRTTAKRPKPGKGQLWIVHADGNAEKLHERDEGHFTAVQLADDGTIYGAVGKDGHIVRVTPDRDEATWIDVDERQVLDLDMIGDEPLFVTGDGAAVYRVAAQRPSEATWTSKVLDAKFGARWGRLTWRGEGQVQVQTRSGNTEKPDATWTDWSQPVASAGPIRSKAGRFLQIRARFSRDPDAVLRAVRAYYLPRNQRPVVTEVKVKDGDAGEGDAPPDPSTEYELEWEVDNPDDDELRYRLRFRQEGQDVWRDILGEDEELTDDEYKWQTNAVPDGWYVVQVEASDENANPATFTKKHTGESEPILIDNHAPRIRGLQQQGGALRGRAVDSLGPIAKLEYAVDGGEWKMFFPSDDLLDTADEQFALSLDDVLDGLEAGEHIVAVRATDAGGNTVSAEVTVRKR